jgi:alkylhydroperoxidase family enzyme
VRFAVARQDGLTEELVDEIDDDYATSSLSPRHRAAIALADAFINAEGPPPDDVQAEILAELTPEEISEVAIGLALFHGFSKLMIAAGAEPDQMPTTILPTPGTR